MFVSTGRVDDLDVSKSLSQYCTFIVQVSKTNHHCTLLNQILLAARLCNLSVVVSLNKITENIKEMQEHFCFVLVLSKLEGWCHAIPFLVFSHCDWLYVVTDSIKW